MSVVGTPSRAFGADSSVTFRQSVQEVLTAVFETVSERGFGHTAALQSYHGYHRSLVCREKLGWLRKKRGIDADRLARHDNSTRLRRFAD
jgi:hypothetical protein